MGVNGTMFNHPSNLHLLWKLCSPSIFNHFQPFHLSTVQDIHLSLACAFWFDNFKTFFAIQLQSWANFQLFNKFNIGAYGRRAQPSSHFHHYFFFNFLAIKPIQSFSCSGHPALYDTYLVFIHSLWFLHNSRKFRSKVAKIFNFSEFGMFRAIVWVWARVEREWFSTLPNFSNCPPSFILHSCYTIYISKRRKTCVHG